MAREEFRHAIFTLTEYLNQYELSPAAQELILHYFNISDVHDSYERALKAIDRYIPERLPGPDDEVSPRLEVLLNELKEKARLWDKE